MASPVAPHGARGLVVGIDGELQELVGDQLLSPDRQPIELEPGLGRDRDLVAALAPSRDVGS